MGSQYVINGSEDIIGEGILEGGALIPASEVLTNNGSYAGVPIITAITAGTGISVVNPASPGAATVNVIPPVVTSIIAGAGVRVINPVSIGPATVSILSSVINNLGDYSNTSLNFSLSNNYNIRALSLIK